MANMSKTIESLRVFDIFHVIVSFVKSLLWGYGSAGRYTALDLLYVLSLCNWIKCINYEQLFYKSMQ